MSKSAKYKSKQKKSKRKTSDRAEYQRNEPDEGSIAQTSMSSAHLLNNTKTVSTASTYTNATYKGDKDTDDQFNVNNAAQRNENSDQSDSSSLQQSNVEQCVASRGESSKSETNDKEADSSSRTIVSNTFNNSDEGDKLVENINNGQFSNIQTLNLETIQSFAAVEKYSRNQPIDVPGIHSLGDKSSKNQFKSIAKISEIVTDTYSTSYTVENACVTTYRNSKRESADIPLIHSIGNEPSRNVLEFTNEAEAHADEGVDDKNQFCSKPENALIEDLFLKRNSNNPYKTLEVKDVTQKSKHPAAQDSSMQNVSSDVIHEYETLPVESITKPPAQGTIIPSLFSDESNLRTNYSAEYPNISVQNECVIPESSKRPMSNGIIPGFPDHSVKIDRFLVSKVPNVVHNCSVYVHNERSYTSQELVEVFESNNQVFNSGIESTEAELNGTALKTYEEKMNVECVRHIKDSEIEASQHMPESTSHVLHNLPTIELSVAPDVPSEEEHRPIIVQTIKPFKYRRRSSSGSLTFPIRLSGENRIEPPARSYSQEILNGIFTPRNEEIENISSTPVHPELPLIVHSAISRESMTPADDAPQLVLKTPFSRRKSSSASVGVMSISRKNVRRSLSLERLTTRRLSRKRLDSGSVTTSTEFYQTACSSSLADFEDTSQYDSVYSFSSDQKGTISETSFNFDELPDDLKAPTTMIEANSHHQHSSVNDNTSKSIMIETSTVTTVIDERILSIHSEKFGPILEIPEVESLQNEASHTVHVDIKIHDKYYGEDLSELPKANLPSSKGSNDNLNLKDWIEEPAVDDIKENFTMRRRHEEGDGDHDEAEEDLMSREENRPPSEAGSHFEIKGDEWNIALLLGLYLLQGIPLGLTAAIPMIIQNRGVSFKQQAEFSFTQWPFSLKLLWAPLVDALYYPSFGRRKTWLVPAQYLIGLFMVILSFYVDTWLNGENPEVTFLTLLFFCMNFLAATQDIAVDGWALTMLKRQNIGLASMCNSVGQSAGFFLGFVVFIALESPSFCNSFLRSEPSDIGLVTLPGFLYFWGIVYILSTTLVMLIKKENSESRSESPSVKSAFKSYQLLMRTTKLPNIQLFSLLLLTGRIGFAAFDSVTSLKFIEKGVPKDKLAILAVPLVPLQIIVPIFITKINHPRRPLDLYLKAYPYRLSFNIVGALFIFATPYMIQGNADIPFYFYLTFIAVMAIHQVATSTMFVQQMAFFAVVSDVDAGGTYMTLLNTLANLGGTWSSTMALAAVDTLTFRSCVGGNSTISSDCSTPKLQSMCTEGGGTCITNVDGYYVEILILTIIGILWFWYGKKKINYLQTRPLSSWAVSRR